MEYQRVVFMGTPHFADEIFKTLLEENYNVVAAVTQPDKPTGRKKILTPSPVKETALAHGISVLQPEKIRREYKEVLDAKPDLIVTCAYGQIVPKEILDTCLCINVHASLLPKYRGGAPMQRSIMANEKETGITIMQMGVGMDDGDMISKSVVEITEEDTLGSLEEKLIESACELLRETLKQLEREEACFTPQNSEEATFARIIKKEEEKIDFQNGYETVYNHIRALIPSPCTYAYTAANQKLKFCAIRKSDLTAEEENGTVLGLVDKAMGIAVDHRILLIDEVQPEGKSQMKARDFMNGAGRKLIHTVLK